MRVVVLTVIFSLLVAKNIFASERYENYNGIRQMGMGGAAAGIANDETALLLNPAGLGKLRGPIFTLIDPEAELNTEAYGFYNSGTTAGYTPTDLQGIVNTAKLADNWGKHVHAKAQLFPSLVTTNFGIGVLGRSVYDVETNAEGTGIRVDYTNDVGLALGYTLRIWDGIIKFGFSGRFFDRTELHKWYTRNATGLKWDTEVSEGGAIAADGGLILTAPIAWLPSISGVIHDAGHTTFNAGTGFQYKTSLRPQTVLQTYDGAFTISPILSNRIRSTLTFEYQDIGNALEPNSTDIYRRLHAGLEINIGDTFFIRGGMNQRYYTAGLELAMEHVQFQATTYGEEIGTDTSPKEDRRYSAKFAFRF